MAPSSTTEQLSIDQILDAERRLAVKPALSRALSIVTGGVEATAFFDLSLRRKLMQLD